MPLIERNGIRLFYELHNSGGDTPLAFIHGFTCNHEDWKFQVDHFRRINTVVTCDLRGHGLSDSDSRHSDIESCTADVIELIDHLGLNEAVLVGHSMGCRIALEAYRQATSKVKALVLIEGSLAGIEGNRDEIEEQTLYIIRKKGYSNMMRDFFDEMFFGEYDPELKEKIVQRVLSAREDIAIPLFTSTVCWDGLEAEAAVSAVNVPLLVIQSTYINSERTRVTLKPGETTTWLDLLKENVPHVRIEIIEDSGHFLMLEQPDKINSMISDFINDL